ncbi:hypothetical protein [Saccharibacillus kuerlensis]|uniref:Uncharacterized protein n=1 Tax=Saccharibacillus kuerlensis TaxID=459527 RepID=A0ABQ2L4I7_9BACL|nr:hypothetical protein [Saccharibacillus kuerlensis]GGO02343.1 hypothetical protein GCM10010969_25560 [Saccharibacillus kuerlensis]
MSESAAHEWEGFDGMTKSAGEEDRMLCERYAPYLMFDLREPFLPNLVGFTRLEAAGESPSFSRSFEDADPRTDFILEYAIWWDYEIGHIHQLEQIWIYVGPNGEVLDCEVTFHGRILKGLLKNRSNLSDGTHVRLFAQPGKHALSPMPELFELLPDLYLAAGPRAGLDGLYAGGEVACLLPAGEEVDEIHCRVRRYLRSFAFKPALEYIECRLLPEQFMPWRELREAIPLRLADRLLELELIFARDGFRKAGETPSERRARRSREADAETEREEAH